jgi:hypothetical protein
VIASRRSASVRVPEPSRFLSAGGNTVAVPPFREWTAGLREAVGTGRCFEACSHERKGFLMMLRRYIAALVVLSGIALAGLLVSPSITAEAAPPAELVQQAQHAFEAEITFSFGPGQAAAGTFPIPQNQRMVVDTITGTVRLFGQSVDSIDRIIFQNFLDSNNDGFQNSDVRFHALQVGSPRQVGGDLVYTISQGTRFYSDFGVTFPAIQIGNVVGVPAGDARFTISGYLAPKP